MRIGFFGDSFCSDIETSHEYTTYIKKLKEHYNADIVHLGVKGTGIWDVALVQLKDFINNPPDILIFCWTTHERVIFNRFERSITPESVTKKFKDNKHIWNASKEYYQHLYDEEKILAEYTAALMYIDQLLLSKFNKSKIVHLWSFGRITSDSFIKDTDPYKQPLLSYDYKFNNGIELQDFYLMKLSIDSLGKDYNSFKNVPNHIHGEHFNQLVFDNIKQAIDSL